MPGMGLPPPPTTKGRATRDRIVDEAATLIFGTGVAGTSLDDVRAAANVSKSQLYHYFADKDDLVHAVIDHTVQGVLDAQPRLHSLSSWTAIREWLDDLVTAQVERRAIGGCPIGSLAGQLSGRDEVGRQRLAEGFARWEAPLRDGLSQMRSAGKLRRSADPARLATATLASIEGGLVLTQTRRDPGQLEIALDAAYAYLRTLSAEGSSRGRA
jgi:AcrR family transcriptional regulator